MSDNKKPKIYTRKTKKTYFSREKKHNFLKNWRVVRYYIKHKYDISSTELELLLYLYDSDIFTKKEFIRFSNTINWQRSKKAKMICNQTYKKLTGEEVISEDKYQNTIFKGENFQDKIYRKLIEKMNQKTKESLYK